MTASAMDRITRPDNLELLGDDVAATYAEWFGTIADPTRLRLLHAVASSASGALTVGDLAERLGISQSTCSHHVRKLSEVGFLVVDRVGRASVVSVNQACCTGLPHAADVVMGTMVTSPCCPTDWPASVTTRAMADDDLPIVREIYAQGIATRNATFETEVPGVAQLGASWLPDHRWVAQVDGRVVGWAAATRVSDRACYAGVAETSVYVADGVRGQGIGKALLYRQVTEADAGGLWTLQTSIFPENRASIALHHSAGYRTLAVRSRIAQLDGVWRDTVLLERRRDDDGQGEDCGPC
ncbi:MAG TPA: metalloregulator ArsR/SmtB family transcription factor [Nocardioides sp.]|uniref:helix-turn-helix domain-containing GNAT family N-acetyltransferase n=1 Tax=uncultured Nocardioides sp. TaxID=198441 RepID=UPI00261403C9|nr:metalloregulator ArsR/SmtB family transcription factor [uncultured Nocardioides sp.]HRD59695.1 metalloregulator ArsR/SmtB family transcription factor [Nocardioides sp.]HRK46240.1 metalloregulator ArsR/SmtB family transcription factor [Nocardioides sp.]